MMHKANEKNLALIIDIDLAVPDLVRGDPGRLSQIITNLLNNALKFTHKGEIGLSAGIAQQLATAEDDDLHLAFIVRDTGIGIAENLLPSRLLNFAQNLGQSLFEA
jgi:two-component system sensor histidine kinase/response regulator